MQWSFAPSTKSSFSFSLHSLNSEQEIQSWPQPSFWQLWPKKNILGAFWKVLAKIAWLCIDAPPKVPSKNWNSVGRGWMFWNRIKGGTLWVARGSLFCLLDAIEKSILIFKNTKYLLVICMSYYLPHIGQNRFEVINHNHESSQRHLLWLETVNILLHIFGNKFPGRGYDLKLTGRNLRKLSCLFL